MQAAEERADAVRKSPPANEQFGDVASGAGTLIGTQPGWDPYEVWRTRVKRSSTGAPQRDPSAVSARSAAQAGTT
jgi:hypothetical protein